MLYPLVFPGWIKRAQLVALLLSFRIPVKTVDIHPALPLHQSVELLTLLAGKCSYYLKEWEPESRMRTFGWGTVSTIVLVFPFSFR